MKNKRSYPQYYKKNYGVVYLDWTLYEGDCFEYLPSISDGSVDMVITDPPYFINYRTSWRCDKSHDFCKPIQGDNSPEMLGKIIPELYRVLKDNSAFYMFCSPDTIDIFKSEIQKWFKIKNIIIWAKNNHTSGDLQAQYGKSYEMIIYANKGRRKFNGPRLKDVWHFDRVVGRGQLHQNQKPTDLIELMIDNSSNIGDVILDPFAGSGTTGVACFNTGRRCIMMEREPEYCEIIRKRMTEVTSQTKLPVGVV